MLTVYGSTRTRAFRVHWMLEELGVPYDAITVDFKKQENRQPEYLAIHPGGKVPALRDGDLTLFESAAILAYLGDKFPEKQLVPRPASRDRALYDQWSCFVTTELEQGLWTMAKHKFALPEDKRIVKMQEIGRWEFTLAAKVLDHALKDAPFLVSRRFTAVDILAGHTLLWALRAEVPLGFPRLENYLERLQQRPAFQRVASRRG